MVGLSIATHQHIIHQNGGSEDNMQARLGNANVKKALVCDSPTEWKVLNKEQRGPQKQAFGN